jgi:hypothetical protein
MGPHEIWPLCTYPHRTGTTSRESGTTTPGVTASPCQQARLVEWYYWYKYQSRYHGSGTELLEKNVGRGELNNILLRGSQLDNISKFRD